MSDLSKTGISALHENSIGRSGKNVQYHKSYIMPGITVFITDITESGNEILQS